MDELYTRALRVFEMVSLAEAKGQFRGEVTFSLNRGNGTKVLEYCLNNTAHAKRTTSQGNKHSSCPPTEEKSSISHPPTEEKNPTSPVEKKASSSSAAEEKKDVSSSLTDEGKVTPTPLAEEKKPTLLPFTEEHKATLSPPGEGKKDTSLSFIDKNKSPACASAVACRGLSETCRDLLEVAKEGHMSEVERLLEEAGEGRARALCTADEEGYTALHLATAHGREEVVAFLVQEADVNACAMDGCTPLHCAVGSRNAAVVELLVNNSTDLNVRSDQGLTALHYAVAAGWAEAVSLLVDGGADTALKDCGGRTALMVGAGGGDTQLLRLLPTANINATDKAGLTALMTAAMWGHSEAVAFLIECGADTECRCALGRTALVYAHQHCHTRVAQCLTSGSAQN